ncbi:MAG TPA: PPC domain-containing DNA-binding protein [Thermomicrobiaceae bacterium]|nr:PPC domain-containing DNA-binding protein [Thermomicrobiaceae bacterium]
MATQEVGLNWKLIEEQTPRTYAVIFDTGDEALSGLEHFAAETGVAASHFTAVGGFSQATLGYFDVEARKYLHIPIDEQVEVLSLVGDITLDGSDRKVHGHVVVGKRDGAAMGGHLLEAHVRPTLEVIVVEAPVPLQRHHDPATGLALISVG